MDKWRLFCIPIMELVYELFFWFLCLCHFFVSLHWKLLVFPFLCMSTEELRSKWKKQLKKDTASKLKSLVTAVTDSLIWFCNLMCFGLNLFSTFLLGKYDQEHEQSQEFQQQLKLKVREILTEQEWRRRKMAMRISEEEGRLKKDEEETKEMWKRKREHEEQWEGTREKRVSSWRDFMKGGKKVKKGEIRPPKLKTEDPNKSYVQRPVKRG
ncbi:uncharacterized protein [Nicotiana tomentosiformis]|uniref:uncharacterized protein isoform X7 n=1 Tax=Nicotiana tomentosiformis TaxID=4098 RepID=UPI00388C6A91